MKKIFRSRPSTLFDLISSNEDPKKLLWKEECEEAFDKLRSCLSSEKVLILPDFTKQFILDTDACNIGVGALLGQLINGVIRPVAYFSKHLSPAQKRYSTTQKELLAIVLSCEHFHQYLYGKSFEVFSDHQPLSWVLSNKKLNSMARWIIRLNAYDFKIIYKKGKININADALSRWPQEEEVEIEPDLNNELPFGTLNFIE